MDAWALLKRLVGKKKSDLQKTEKSDWQKEYTGI